MTKHYFIAIKIPMKVANAIIQERDKTNLQKTHKILPVAEDLHITLYYLGHVADDTLTQIIDSLHRLEWGSFELTTSGVAQFGSDVTPRVVYTALEKSNPLQFLQQKIVERLADIIEVQKKNDFTAHITIAKKWAAKESVNLVNFTLPNLAFNVDSFSIYTINVTQSPRYEEVSTFLNRGGK
ncbi:2'-5' RNA ligase [Psychrobacillus sp. OK028]|uniref:RNA 2',3'-cyclic phosphodiesterase n=1 Tax=Psychrobacillus sp. OK028 TaxID=1884359 RepID=UPI00089090D6|nr:RNA 2',3'-cyclic phosphodiesterase [Psychrobacillus sp. OK028]SDM71360.1 2'-5' RNA ligase [Psychrobacillus sp. OK028]